MNTLLGGGLTGGSGGDEDHTIPEAPPFLFEAGETIRRGDRVAISDDGRLYTVRPGPDTAERFDRGIHLVSRVFAVLFVAAVTAVAFGLAWGVW